MYTMNLYGILRINILKSENRNCANVLPPIDLKLDTLHNNVSVFKLYIRSETLHSIKSTSLYPAERILHSYES